MYRITDELNMMSVSVISCMFSFLDDLIHYYFPSLHRYFQCAPINALYSFICSSVTLGPISRQEGEWGEWGGGEGRREEIVILLTLARGRSPLAKALPVVPLI